MTVYVTRTDSHIELALKRVARREFPAVELATLERDIWLQVEAHCMVRQRTLLLSLAAAAAICFGLVLGFQADPIITCDECLFLPEGTQPL